MKRTAPLSHNHQKVANELLGKTGVLENRYCGPDPTLSRSFKGHEDAISAIDFDPKMYIFKYFSYSISNYFVSIFILGDQLPLHLLIQ